MVRNGDHIGPEKGRIAMEKKNRRKNIWAGSILLAFLSALVVFGVLLQLERKALAEFEKETVYLAKTDIYKGQMIDNENFEVFMEPKEINVAYIPEHAVKDQSNIGGMISLWDIEKGVILTEGMFRTVDHVTENMKEPVIAGLKADDIYQVSGGVLRSGDRIDIFGVNEDGSVTLKWSNVYIEQVFDSSGKSIAPSDTAAAAQRINIYLDRADVERLYSDLGSGNLRVVKVCD